MEVVLCVGGGGGRGGSEKRWIVDGGVLHEEILYFVLLEISLLIALRFNLTFCIVWHQCVWNISLFYDVL